MQRYTESWERKIFKQFSGWNDDKLSAFLYAWVKKRSRGEGASASTEQKGTREKSNNFHFIAKFTFSHLFLFSSLQHLSPFSSTDIRQQIKISKLDDGKMKMRKDGRTAWLDGKRETEESEVYHLIKDEGYSTCALSQPQLNPYTSTIIRNWYTFPSFVMMRIFFFAFILYHSHVFLLKVSTFTKHEMKSLCIFTSITFPPSKFVV